MLGSILGMNFGFSFQYGNVRGARQGYVNTGRKKDVEIGGNGPTRRPCFSKNGGRVRSYGGD